MKKLQTRMGLALCGVLLAAGITASASTGKPGFATVVRVKGFAEYSLDNGVHKYPLVPGKYLDQGATIYTGTNGTVDVVMGKSIEMPQAKWVPERISYAVDAPVRGLITYTPSAEQNVIRLMENTTLVIDKLTTKSRYEDSVNDTELNLKSGSIYASVKKMTVADQYLVKTPKGMAGVRGTQFSLILKDNGDIQSLAVYRVTDPVHGGVLLAPDGVTPPFPVMAQQMWVSGGSSVIPVPSSLYKYLATTFDAVRTIYISVLNYDYDLTRVLESSNYGGH